MHDVVYDDDLALALRLADEADRITTAYFGRVDLAVSEKADHTPVSEADQATERAIREILHAERPGDGILGEEYGAESGTSDPAVEQRDPAVEPVETKGSLGPEVDDSMVSTDALSARCSTDESGRQWIIDPIDGTKNYVRGVPVWATLIGLADGDEVVVGVVSAPALGRRWWAAKGRGAWLSVNGGEPKQIKVSNIDSLSDASISYASLGGWGAKQPQLLALLDQAARTRAYGDFWSYMLVAEGAVDIAAEPELETYDMAALVPIVTEAGGAFTSLSGQPGPWGGNAIATNSILHDAARAALA